MEVPSDEERSPGSSVVLSNAEIPERFASLAQLLSSQKENPYKIKAYHRAAAGIPDLSEGLDEMVRGEENLTYFWNNPHSISADVLAGALRTAWRPRIERIKARKGHDLDEVSYPDQKPKSGYKVWKDAVQRIARGMRVAIDRKKYLNAKQRSHDYQNPALPGN